MKLRFEIGTDFPDIIEQFVPLHDLDILERRRTTGRMTGVGVTSRKPAVGIVAEHVVYPV